MSFESWRRSKSLKQLCIRTPATARESGSKRHRFSLEIKHCNLWRAGSGIIGLSRITQHTGSLNLNIGLPIRGRTILQGRNWPCYHLHWSRILPSGRFRARQSILSMRPWTSVRSLVMVRRVATTGCSITLRVGARLLGARSYEPNKVHRDSNGAFGLYELGAPGLTTSNKVRCYGLLANKNGMRFFNDRTATCDAPTQVTSIALVTDAGWDAPSSLTHIGLKLSRLSFLMQASKYNHP